SHNQPIKPIHLNRMGSILINRAFACQGGVARSDRLGLFGCGRNRHKDLTLFLLRGRKLP
ncbi:MAG: hypothetical protein RMJ84_07525, partial [Sandaracinaceae bacterium]|nr:hypothetical protein [Sandaracinaceae bacterium]